MNKGFERLAILNSYSKPIGGMYDLLSKRYKGITFFKDIKAADNTQKEYGQQQEQKRKAKFVLTEEKFNKIAEFIARQLKEAAQNKAYVWRAYYSKQ